MDEVQQDKADRLAALVASDDFQELIMQDYVQSTVDAVGKNFSGSQDDVDALKAVSSFNNYIMFTYN